MNIGWSVFRRKSGQFSSGKNTSITSNTALTVSVAFNNANTGAIFWFDKTGNLTTSDLTGVRTEGVNFTSCAMPSNADTKAEFKAIVKSYDAVTTIWTDGSPIG